ncbi:MAG: hypothetical protein J6A97_05185 [Clostridia bacterium]|nr:hypothetical protein [Clostridia bacterium]
MGKTKKTQFFFGLLIGISVWAAGIIITGFLPTFGDGIEFGYRSALPIIIPGAMWAVCVFFGIKTAKNGKKVFFNTYSAVLLIPIVSLLLAVILGDLENRTGEEVFDSLSAAVSVIAVPFMGSVVYGADIAFLEFNMNLSDKNIFDDILFFLYLIIAASSPIAGIVAKKLTEKRRAEF